MTTDVWVDSSTMAAALGISVKTLHRLRVDTTADAFLEQGIHFRPKTPKPGSPLVWDRERTIKAWQFASKPGGAA
jgi:hypothetical protein